MSDYLMTLGSPANAAQSYKIWSFYCKHPYINFSLKRISNSLSPKDWTTYHCCYLSLFQWDTNAISTHKRLPSITLSKEDTDRDT